MNEKLPSANEPNRKAEIDRAEIQATRMKEAAEKEAIARSREAVADLLHSVLSSVDGLPNQWELQKTFATFMGEENNVSTSPVSVVPYTEYHKFLADILLTEGKDAMKAHFLEDLHKFFDGKEGTDGLEKMSHSIERY